MNSLVGVSLIGSSIIYRRVENFEITAFPLFLIDEFNCKKRFHASPLVVQLYSSRCTTSPNSIPSIKQQLINHLIQGDMYHELNTTHYALQLSI